MDKNSDGLKSGAQSTWRNHPGHKRNHSRMHAKTYLLHREYTQNTQTGWRRLLLSSGKLLVETDCAREEHGEGCARWLAFFFFLGAHHKLRFRSFFFATVL